MGKLLTFVFFNHDWEYEICFKLYPADRHQLKRYNSSSILLVPRFYIMMHAGRKHTSLTWLWHISNLKHAKLDFWIYSFPNKIIFQSTTYLFSNFSFPTGLLSQCLAGQNTCHTSSPTHDRRKNQWKMRHCLFTNPFIADGSQSKDLQRHCLFRTLTSCL